MFRKRFVFNIVGEKSHVDKASLEIKEYISEITKEPVDIIMENKDTIFHKINVNNKNCKYWNINKCYIDNNKDKQKEYADIITELSRQIRWTSRDFVHPWNLHVEEVDSRYVSDFMNKCSQINCVYPLNATEKDKKDSISVYVKDA